MIFRTRELLTRFPVRGGGYANAINGIFNRPLAVASALQLDKRISLEFIHSLPNGQPETNPIIAAAG